MLLASVAPVREGLGFDDMDDPNKAIAQALHAATPRLAGRLRTTFDRATRSDVFFVPSSEFHPGVRRTELRLSQGFLDLTQPLAAVAAASYAELATGQDISLAMIPQAEAGALINLETAFDKSYVRVDYTAGFLADGLDPESYDLSFVPDWLQEAAKFQALITLAEHPLFANVDTNKEKPDTKDLTRQLNDILNTRVRYRPAAFKPLN